ncbi:MAG: TolC family protein [Myxococcales bacterium]|nr:TolC family protein [Myxococcales bacterium]
MERRSTQAGGAARLIAVAAAVVVIAARDARAQAPAPAAAPTIRLEDDPQLAALVAESLAARPELAAAAAGVDARRPKVALAGAWPDPVLTLGVQNDGFASIEIGAMETSFASIMVTQTIPWPGKRRARAALAELAVDRAGLDVARARLSAIAEVERAYLALVRVRDRQALLAQQAALWARAVEITRRVYGAGQGSQADVLRAQLEVRRLEQRRLALAAEEQQRLHALNRLRGRALDEPLPTARSIAGLALPAPIDVDAAYADARAHSPELAQAALAVTAAERAVTLASRAARPDLAVSAGLMVRGVDLPPMWTVAVGGPLPLFTGAAARRAVAGDRAEVTRARLELDALERVLRQRVADRAAALAGLTATVTLYHDGILALSSATADSTLAQYQSGRASFAAVLDAGAGILVDQDAYLDAITATQAIAIAAREYSLDDATAAAGGLARGAMPTGGAGAASSAARATTAAPAAAVAAPAASGMGGM